MNSTFTFTGDLGTESYVTGYKGNLKKLFGPWVVDSDRFTDRSDAPDGIVEEAPTENNEDDPGFEFPGASGSDAEPDFDFGRRAEPADRPFPQYDDIAYAIDFTACIFVPGIMHIIQNITKDIRKA